MSIEEQEKHFYYLDVLRESGKTNMFGSAPFLANEFGLTIRQARTIVGNYMRHKQESYNGNLFL